MAPVESSLLLLPAAAAIMQLIIWAGKEWIYDGESKNESVQ